MKEKKIMAYIFMPVGTSFLTNFNSSQEVRRGSDDPGILNLFSTNSYRGHLDIDLDTVLSDTWPASRKKPSAEICSLYGFWKRKWNDDDERQVKVFLLHSPSPAGIECSRRIRELITKRDYFKTRNTSWEPEEIELTGLDPNRPDDYSGALDTLATTITETIKDFSGEIYINISGGYKALVPYLTMMAMASAKPITVFYLFEDSPQIIFLPSYPFAFDISQWRDWRGMLLPFTHSGLFSKDQLQSFLHVLEHTRVAGLLQDDGVRSPEGGTGYKLNSVGQILKQNYDEGADTLTEFGQGHLLLDDFSDKCYADYLKKYCIPRWQHLAVGDHIPETVEHGRGHVQRLLELAQQLLLTVDLDLSDEQRFVLVCSIWLHDLGHSGNDFSFRGQDGFVQDKNDPESTESFFVHGFPDLVRKHHNFLSWELIEKEENFLFKCLHSLISNDADRKKILNSIGLACLFHRRAMPVYGKDTPCSVGQCLVTKSICDFHEGTEVINGFSTTAALLRVLDGAENQQERSGSTDSYEVTNWVIGRQVNSLKKYLTTMKSDARSTAEYQFKKKQPEHFSKHRLIRNVLIVKESFTTLKNKKLEGHSNDLVGIFGKQTSEGGNNSETKLAGVYFIGRKSAGPDDEQETIITKIIMPFLDEFLLVQQLLPFNLALIYVPDVDGETITKYQVCITYQDNKGQKLEKTENWTYELLPCSC